MQPVWLSESHSGRHHHTTYAGSHTQSQLEWRPREASKIGRCLLRGGCIWRTSMSQRHRPGLRVSWWDTTKVLNVAAAVAIAALSEAAGVSGTPSTTHAPFGGAARVKALYRSFCSISCCCCSLQLSSAASGIVAG